MRTNISHLGKAENHLQKVPFLGRGSVSFQDITSKSKNKHLKQTTPDAPCMDYLPRLGET